jgi:hypothetical protein
MLAAFGLEMDETCLTRKKIENIVKIRKKHD